MSDDIVARLVRWHTAMADEPKRAESKRTKHRETADLIERQAARIKELEKDAERYRFLRDVDPDAELPAASVHKMNDWGKWCYLHLGGDELDAAIDAALDKADK